VAVGDWGGKSDYHPTTPGQVATASGMASVAKAMGSSAILLLGDNFYEEGVNSAQSPRFQETFEDVYRQDLFDALPFLVVAGNHDHRGDVTAQLSYQDSGRRWSFPDLFYTTAYNYTSKAGSQRTVTFIMIDTVTLAGISDDGCRGCNLPGPADADIADDRWAWLEAQLQNGQSSDFLFVVGHYPIYSAGDDGTTKVLVERLLPLLAAHGAHYLSGHAPTLVVQRCRDVSRWRWPRVLLQRWTYRHRTTRGLEVHDFRVWGHWPRCRTTPKPSGGRWLCKLGVR